MLVSQVPNTALSFRSPQETNLIWGSQNWGWVGQRMVTDGFCCCCWSRKWTLSFTLARQALYHWTRFSLLSLLLILICLAFDHSVSQGSRPWTHDSSSSGFGTTGFTGLLPQAQHWVRESFCGCVYVLLFLINKLSSASSFLSVALRLRAPYSQVKTFYAYGICKLWQVVQAQSFFLFLEKDDSNLTVPSQFP